MNKRDFLLIGTMFVLSAAVIDLFRDLNFQSGWDDPLETNVGNRAFSLSTSEPSNASVPLPPFPALSESAREQIQNYRQDAALIVNVHITHHAGTTVCGEIGNGVTNKRSPDFACMGDRSNLMNGTFPSDWPWTRDETAAHVAEVRPYFHFVSWEFGQQRRRPLSGTEWESPHLLSMIVMRHPIDRLLAGDGAVFRRYPGLLAGNGTLDQWWAYATDSTRRNTNNYALGILSERGCCDGGETDPKYLEQAKALLRRFTVVLDQDCLDEGLDAFARLANLTVEAGRRRRGKTPPPPARDRIGHDDVYEFLLEKNRLDIELYEWSKSLSLVKC